MSFRDWLFRDHSEQELRRWAISLRYFRFCRAYGGHANDGDSFRAAIGFATEAELIGACRHLGVALWRVPPDAPVPEPNRRYSVEEFTRFPDRIPDFPHWQQPGSCEIHSVAAFLWVEPGALAISVAGASGSESEVAEADFENALRLDDVVSPLAERIIDPPQDNRHCVCPKYYPDLWESGAGD